MKRYFLIILFSTFFLTNLLISKSLPDNMAVSEDGLRLINSAQESDGLYDVTQIKTIYLNFSQSNWWQLLTNNYNSKTDIPANLIYDGVTYEGVGVHFRGYTSYMFLYNSQKKSFNISIDYQDSELKLMGYKTLNLNNCYEDPSFIRDALYSHFAGINNPLYKVNFVKLVINDVNWGVYSNVQQLNGDFYEEWFLNNDGANWRAEMAAGTGGGFGGFGPGGLFGEGYCSMNYLGMDTSSYLKYYNLKSSDIENPWEKLANACIYLNLSDKDELYDTLQHYLDIDRALWYIANEIVFTDDDGYVNKGGSDYFIYYDEATDRVTPIDCDGNSTFLTEKVNLSPYFRETDTKFPLINKLFASPELKQRYTAHLRTIIKNCLNEEYANSVIDKFITLITPEVKLDTKKIYSDNQFTSSITEIKNFIKNRKTNLLKNQIVSAVPPEIKSVKYISSNGENLAPNSSSSVTVQANVSSSTGISQVILYWGTELMGTFNRVTMYDDGNHNDCIANDGIFAAEIPAQSPYTYVRYYIEARSDNSYQSSSFNPEGAEHDVYFYQVQSQKVNDFPVVINEIMASNETIIKDPQEEYDDWVELYNRGNENIDLSGMYLSDKVDNPKKWQFPENTIINAGGYLLLWADENSKATPGIHTNFKLSADGEVVLLTDKDANGNSLLDSVSFGGQDADISFGRYPNGTGLFYKMTPTPLALNNMPLNSVEDLKNYISLSNVFPNPFEENIALEFNVKNTGYYEISVLDMTGYKINTIFKDRLEVGNYSFSWNGMNQIGNEVSNGTYFIRIISNGKSITIPVIKI
ncbi:MAG TPA: CotH kinase family protein [Candidatus Kapabacteria bacterium]|nr:CotH kinase family protein [Candidatus Kapabacteria bacterium]HPO62618.1 CotH kinase family protein [Candidatus Kapabacteria bacterium]